MTGGGCPRRAPDMPTSSSHAVQTSAQPSAVLCHRDSPNHQLPCPAMPPCVSTRDVPRMCELAACGRFSSAPALAVAHGPTRQSLRHGHPSPPMPTTRLASLPPVGDRAVLPTWRSGTTGTSCGAQSEGTRALSLSWQSPSGLTPRLRTAARLCAWRSSRTLCRTIARRASSIGSCGITRTEQRRTRTWIGI